jgi:uncharacterized protein YjdB
MTSHAKGGPRASRSWRRLTAAAIVGSVFSCQEAGTPTAAGVAGLLEVRPGQVTIAVGSTATLSAFTFDQDGNDVEARKAFWSVENSTIATVSQSGVVSGLTPGTTQIAASLKGTSGIALVTVTPRPVAHVLVVPPQSEVEVGKTVQFGAEARDADDNLLSGVAVDWSVGNPGIATVSASGFVTGTAAGATLVRATAGGVSGTALVTVVLVPVSSVVVKPPTATLTAGGFVQLATTISDRDGDLLTGRLVTWNSTDQSVAVVSSSGRVQSVSPGSATITATSGGVSGTSAVTVIPGAAATLQVTPASPALTVGETLQLMATVRDAQGNVITGDSIGWATSDVKIATVSAAGVLSAVAVGTATVTASDGGATGTTAITVSLAPIATLDVTPSPATVQEKHSLQLTATARDARGDELLGRTIEWSSSNGSAASVSQTGLVTGISSGQVTITASAPGEGIGGTTPSGSSAVTVSATPVASVVVQPPTATVHAGSAYARQFMAETRDASGSVLSGRTIVWSSSAPSVATVDAATGVVTGVAPGAATVRATSEGVSGVASVTVDLVAIATVDVAPPTVDLVAPATAQLGATPRDSSGTAVSGAALGGRATTWSSSDQAVATVSPAGLVSTVASGVATITAQVDTARGTSTVTVVPTVASVALSLAADSVIIPGTVGGTVTVLDGGGQPVPGQRVGVVSSDPSIASVAPDSGTADASGELSVTVTGVAPGTATITATGGGASDAKVIRVVAATGSVTIKPSSLTVGVGKTGSLAVHAVDSGGTPLPGVSCAMSSSNILRALVTPLTGVTNGSGEIALTVTGVSKGGVTVTAACGIGSASAAVTIK